MAQINGAVTYADTPVPLSATHTQNMVTVFSPSSVDPFAMFYVAKDATVFDAVVTESGTWRFVIQGCDITGGLLGSPVETTLQVDGRITSLPATLTVSLV